MSATASGGTRFVGRTSELAELGEWLTECESVLAAIDADVAGHTALTPREREIVVLVTEGLSNRQIAERLYVSERTVETHVSHVLAKLGGGSRTEIATWALGSGVLAERG